MEIKAKAFLEMIRSREKVLTIDDLAIGAPLLKLMPKKTVTKNRIYRIDSINNQIIAKSKYFCTKEKK